MLNFIGLPWVDTTDFLCSLRPRAALFAGRDVRTLILRGPKKGAEDEDDTEAYVRSREVAKWPEYRALRNRIEQLGEKIVGAPLDFGRITLEWLDPGVCVPWQRLHRPYFNRFDRVHLALRTNPFALLYSGCEQYHLPAGQLVLIKVAAPHSAINLGDAPRVHLILDVGRKQAKAEC